MLLAVVVVAGVVLLTATIPQGVAGTGGDDLAFLMEINLFWPILNLLPIWPLDGGQMAREVFVAASPRNGDSITLAVSAGVAGLAALHCALSPRPRPLRAVRWAVGGMYLAIFFALLCVQSIMTLPGR